MGSLDRKFLHFFPIDFWKIAKHKICVQQRVVILARFVYQDNLYKLIQNVYILKPI